MKKINISTIRIDGGTQSRVEINTEAVAEYAEAIKDGVEFPAVIVFNDGADCWLADGFHRYHAHKAASKVSILAEVKSGTVRDAILYSLSANASHGLRRTNADKRKAVLAMLNDTEWAGWSDRKIADVCGVGHPMVAAMRRPEIAEKQQQNRATSAAKASPKVESDSTPAVQKQPKRTLNLPEEQPANEDQLIEAQHTISDLAKENDELRDKLAVESLMDSEEAKTQTLETIQELRDRVRNLEAENAALKVSRDTYQREASEAKKSAIYWRKQAEKAAKEAA